MLPACLIAVPIVLLAPRVPNDPPAKPALVKRHAERKLPPPRVTQRLPDWIPYTNSIQRICAVTPRVVVFQISHQEREGSPRFVALDRRTGSVLWNRTPGGIALREQFISDRWEVLGSVAAKNGESIVVLQRFITYSPQAPNASERKFEIELYGVYDYNGQTRWQYPALTAAPTNELFASRIVGELLPMGSPSVSPIQQFWDAQTGTPIDKTTPAGSAALEQAIRANGSPLLQTPYVYAQEICLTRLDTGVSYPFPFQMSGDQNATPKGVTTDRALWKVTGDDGGVGHSGWSDYLICTDDKGKFLWQFPAKPIAWGVPETFPVGKDGKPDEKRAGIEYRSVTNVLLFAEEHKEAMAVVQASGWVDGVRLRDGKPLWSRLMPGVAASSGGGLFFVHFAKVNYGLSSSVRLEFLDATTGKTRKTWPMLGTVQSLNVVGDDLLTVDKDGIVCIYSCKQLLQK